MYRHRMHDFLRQIVLATLRTVELLEGDGSAPYPWPIEMDDHDNAVFLASPALHDVDGDGVQVCSLTAELNRFGN